jgi:broad specificity phosphatase PhoE
MTELILLRHGETVGQSSIRLYGATDIPLSPVGEQQATRAAAALRSHGFTRIVTSPLQRARRSAEIVLAAQPPGAQLEVVDDLREVDFGAWEGLTWAEIAARDPDNHRRWHTDRPHFTFPGGEARPDFTRRIHAAARAIPQGPGPTLAVLHKGVIKSVIAALTGMPPEQALDLPVPLASLQRLVLKGDAWQLVAVGQTDHLGDLYIPD